MCALVQWVFNNFPCDFAEALTQGSEPLSKSLCLSYGTCWSILKQNKRHLRMLISWTKKSPSIAQIYRIFVLSLVWSLFFFGIVLVFFSVCFLFCFKTTYLTTLASSGGQTNDAKKTHHFRPFSEIPAPAYEIGRILSEELARFIAVIGNPL